MVGPVCAEANLLGKEGLRGVGTTADHVLTAPSVEGDGRRAAVGDEPLPVPSEGVDLDFSCPEQVPGVLEGLFEELAALVYAGEL